MKMRLNEIEKHIDESVLSRGLDYFNDGLVTRCEEVTAGNYEAVVEGTDDYVVRIALKDGIVRDCSCDCPYDFGPICKHIAAVCFHLRKDDSNSKKSVAKSNRIRRPAKRKTVAEQVNEVLERITHDELKQFTSENALRDRSFREIFLSSFAADKAVESRASYARRIKAILRSASDRHGFIGWSASGQVSRPVFQLLDSAQKQIEAQNYMNAVHIYTAVMEQMVKALQYADDSNGSLGDCIVSAYEKLFEIAELPLPENVRRHLINYCFSAYEKKKFKGWDWHIGVLRLASMLVKTEEELLSLLARTSEPGLSNYEAEEAECITYQALLNVRGDQEAQAYLEQHVSNPGLRRKAIENELNGKRYDRARSLADDGIEYDRAEKPGLAWEWHDWLLKIAQAQKDRENILKQARLLFVVGFRREQDYYELLKQHVERDKWPILVNELIEDIRTKSRGYPAGRIAEIYVREGLHDRLLELIRTDPSLESIERHERHLKKDYANDLAMLYADAVAKYVRENTGRPHYKTAAKFIRRIKELGAPELAAKVAQSLRAEYPQRRALQEELDSA